MITRSITEAHHIAGHNLIIIMEKFNLFLLSNSMHLKPNFGTGYAIIAVFNDVHFFDLLGEVISTEFIGEEILFQVLEKRLTIFQPGQMASNPNGWRVGLP